MTRRSARIDSGGHVQLPAEFRAALRLADGDAVMMEMKDGDLVVRPYRAVLAQVQARLGGYVPEGVSLADELIADRRAEAERE
jgi:AbrB family looped-hinge helix DNA binding protein